MLTDKAYEYGSHDISSYRKQYVNKIYCTESPMIPTPDHMHHTDIDNVGNSRVKTLELSNDYQVVSGVKDLDQPELEISREYQAYLQGSLTKFIGNLNGH